MVIFQFVVRFCNDEEKLEEKSFDVCDINILDIVIANGILDTSQSDTLEQKLIFQTYGVSCNKYMLREYNGV